VFLHKFQNLIFYKSADRLISNCSSDANAFSWCFTCKYFKSLLHVAGFIWINWEVPSGSASLWIILYYYNSKGHKDNNLFIDVSFSKVISGADYTVSEKTLWMRVLCMNSLDTHKLYNLFIHSFKQQYKGQTFYLS